MNFFDQSCQEEPVNAAEFGLCDPQNGQKAFTDLHHPDQWIATVKNKSQLDLIFTAIDNCILQNYEEPGRKRCDGMLTSNQHLYLVELKDKSYKWQEEAIQQLESTIQLLLANHDISQFQHKKAFAANKRRRDEFIVLDNDVNRYFFETYRFRIDIQTDIIIV